MDTVVNLSVLTILRT